MLLFVEGNVVEIRPGELFESKVPVESRHLTLISEPEKKKKRSTKVNTKAKKASPSPLDWNLDNEQRSASESGS